MFKTVSKKNATSNYRVRFISADFYNKFVAEHPKYDKQIFKFVDDGSPECKIVRFRYQKTLTAVLAYFKGYISEAEMDLRDLRLKNLLIAEEYEMQPLITPLPQDIISQYIKLLNQIPLIKAIAKSPQEPSLKEETAC